MLCTKQLQRPLPIDLAAPAQREAVEPLCAPQVAEHRFDSGSEWQKYTAYRLNWPGGLPLALRFSGGVRRHVAALLLLEK